MIFFDWKLIDILNMFEDIFGRGVMDYAVKYTVDDSLEKELHIIAWVMKDLVPDYDKKLEEFIRENEAEEVGKSFIANHRRINIKLIPT
jgi:hypothetical protein